MCIIALGKGAFRSLTAREPLPFQGLSLFHKRIRTDFRARDHGAACALRAVKLSSVRREVHLGSKNRKIYGKILPCTRNKFNMHREHCTFLYAENANFLEFSQGEEERLDSR